MTVHETPRSRRSLLAAGAAAVTGAVAAAVARPLDAVAANGDPVILGTVNQATATTEVSSIGGDPALNVVAEAAVGIRAMGTEGVIGQGGHTGVHGMGDHYGVLGHSFDFGIGVRGESDDPDSIGVEAASLHGLALHVVGAASFSHSGKFTVPAGRTYATKVAPVRAGTLMMAMLQSNESGVWIRAAVASASGGRFNVYFNKALTSSATVGWIAFDFPA